MNTKHVTFAGDFLKKTEVDILRPIEAVLTRIGEETVPVMKGFIKNNVSRAATGDLEGSIAWRTATNHSQVETADDLIEAPPAHCVDIGSANNHAVYVDRGSGPHLNPEGSEEFVAEIKDWVRRMGWDESVAFPIIKNIREQGTDAIPFIEPTGNKLQSIATPICREAIRTYWAKQRQV